MPTGDDRAARVITRYKVGECEELVFIKSDLFGAEIIRTSSKEGYFKRGPDVLIIETDRGPALYERTEGSVFEAVTWNRWTDDKGEHYFGALAYVQGTGALIPTDRKSKPLLYGYTRGVVKEVAEEQYRPMTTPTQTCELIPVRE